MSVINMQDLLQQHKSIVIGAISATLFLVGIGALYLYTAIPLPGGDQPLDTIQTKSAPPQIVTVPSRAGETTSARYLLPKSKVTPAYSAIYNAIANETLALNATYESQMASLGAKAQTAIKNKNYQALMSLGEQVKVVNDEQKNRLAILAADFDNLAAVNKTLSDQKTMNLTEDFITTGKNMVQKFTAYSALLDTLVSGATTQSVTSAKAIVSDLTPASTAFLTASTKLSEYFTATLISDTKAFLAASSTPL